MDNNSVLINKNLSLVYGLTTLLWMCFFYIFLLYTCINFPLSVSYHDYNLSCICSWSAYIDLWAGCIVAFQASCIFFMKFSIWKLPHSCIIWEPRSSIICRNLIYKNTESKPFSHSAYPDNFLQFHTSFFKILSKSLPSFCLSFSHDFWFQFRLHFESQLAFVCFNCINLFFCCLPLLRMMFAFAVLRQQIVCLINSGCFVLMIVIHTSIHFIQWSTNRCTCSYHVLPGICHYSVIFVNISIAISCRRL